MDSPQPWHQAPAVSRSSQFRAGSGNVALENYSLDPPCSWGWWRRRSSWWCAPPSCSSRWTCWSRPGRRCLDRPQQVIQGTRCRMNSFDTQHSQRDQKNHFLLIKIDSGKNVKNWGYTPSQPSSSSPPSRVSVPGQSSKPPQTCEML